MYNKYPDLNSWHGVTEDAISYGESIQQSI